MPNDDSQWSYAPAKPGRTQELDSLIKLGVSTAMVLLSPVDPNRMNKEVRFVSQVHEDIVI
jgi:hypothetical protein